MDTPTPSPMATERIGVLLWRYSLPAIVGMVVNALYNVVDRLYIGQGVGRDAIAGLTLTLPYMTVLAAFGMLIGIGSGALVSINLGRGRRDVAEQILGQALALIGGMVLVVPTVAFLTLDQTLRWFGGTEGSIPYAREYLNVILYGNAFTHVSFGFNHLMRAEGSARRAMRAMVLGAVANLVLDPLFIFGFGMGIQGAAWATVLAMMMSSVVALRHFRGPHSTIKLRMRNLRIQPRLATQVLAIGLSPFSLQLVASMVMVVYTRTLRIHAANPVETLNATATIGIVNGVAILMLMPIFGLSGGVQPILGFNFGAQHYDRVRQAFRLVAKAASLTCTVGALLIQAGAPWIVRAFTRDAELIRLATPALRIMTLGFPLIGVPIMATTYFQSVGKPKASIVLSLLRQAFLLIPLIVLLPKRFGIPGVWAAAPISDMFSAVVVWTVMAIEMRRMRCAGPHRSAAAPDPDVP